MSRKKTLKSKGASAPAASALPAANGPRPARPGAEAAPSGRPQPGRPSLGGGGDFYDVAFKVMLVGDSGVGKTCLLVRFKDGAFLAGTFISTVGIDFRVRVEPAAPSPFSHPHWVLLSLGSWSCNPRPENKVLDVDGTKVKLQLWDTAGQERFRSVTHAYYRDAHALLLLYDVTSKASFDNIQAWLTEIRESAQPDVVLMLLGNKVDSAQEHAVRREDGEKLAKEYGLPFMETSAKTGLNVDLAFTAIAKELKQRSMKAPSEPHFRLHDYVEREGRGASCCRP